MSRAGWFRAAALAILLAHAALLACAAALTSPTWDEPAHLASGLATLGGDTGAYRVNPPLVRSVAALPAWLSGVRVEERTGELEPGERPEFGAGARLLGEHGAEALRLVELGRWACVPFSLLGALACGEWARRLHGPWAGLLALALWCACPNVLGHGALITPDVGGAALLVAAAFAAWRLLTSPSWGWCAAAGVGLGLALLARTTAVALAPVVACACVASWRGRAAALHGMAQLACWAGAALLVLNVGYGFADTAKPLGAHRFVSGAWGGTVVASGSEPHGNRFAGRAIGRLPVPVPEDWLLGLDVQARTFERGDVAYARGTFRDGGWWWFYLYGLLVKLPLGTLALVTLAAIATAHGASPGWRAEALVVGPAALVLALASLTAPGGGHVRHALLPVVPFLFVFASRIASHPRRVMRALAATAVVLTAGSSLRQWPHSISYFNEAAGGPARGGFHFVDSNVDWGQDVAALARWAREHPEARPLHVAVFGSVDPHLYGLDYVVSSGGVPEPGWHAVSVTALRGYRLLAPTSPGGPITMGGDSTAFQSLEPVDRIGGSILVYRVDGPS